MSERVHRHHLSGKGINGSYSGESRLIDPIIMGYIDMGANDCQELGDERALLPSLMDPSLSEAAGTPQGSVQVRGCSTPVNSLSYPIIYPSSMLTAGSFERS